MDYLSKNCILIEDSLQIAPSLESSLITTNNKLPNHDPDSKDAECKFYWYFEAIGILKNLTMNLREI